MYRQWFLILWVNRNSIQFQFEDECGECFLHFQLFMVPIWICKSLISSVLLKRVACSFQSTIHLGGILPSQFKCKTFVSQFIPYFLVSQFSPYFFKGMSHWENNCRSLSTHYSVVYANACLRCRGLFVWSSTYFSRLTRKWLYTCLLVLFCTCTKSHIIHKSIRTGNVWEEAAHICAELVHWAWKHYRENMKKIPYHQESEHSISLSIILK